MDGWTCPEGHLIDNDGSCPCTDRVLSTWGSLAGTIAEVKPCAK
jgi:hypothetical protein